jgi:hypothetical protein
MLGTLWRPRRGEVSWLVFAAVLALLVLPGVGQAATLAAPMHAQSCEAILMWLHSEAATASQPQQDSKAKLLSLTHRLPQAGPRHSGPVPIQAWNAPPETNFRAIAFTVSDFRPASPPSLLEYHEAAHRTGTRTNRRLN